eukprot:m51a1_g10550 putative serine-threonine protein (710) ;mRNA; r:34890-37960
MRCKLRIQGGIVWAIAAASRPYDPNAADTSCTQKRPNRCPTDTSTDGSWAQLFVPEAVPWRYSSLCFQLDYGVFQAAGAAAAGELGDVRGAVELYDVSTSASTMVNRPGNRVARTAFHFTLPATNGTSWYTVDLGAGFVAYQSKMFIVVSLSSCRGLGVRGTALTKHKTPVSMFSVCDSSYLWTKMSSLSSLSFRARGSHDNTTVPSEWQCTEARYRDSKCDCMCGAWDPACAKDPAHSEQCQDGWICDRSGECFDPAWKTCDEKGYDALDGCDCSCGGLSDPDCFEANQAVNNCKGMNIPLCYFGGLIGEKCQEQWTCNMSQYKDGKVCDCECGEDPDCDNPDNPTSCADNWQCFRSQCQAPREWKCLLSDYNDGALCNCECGAYDPDCAISPQSTCGDPKTTWCTFNGTCADVTCGNGRLEAFGLDPEECDGGLGCHPLNCTCLPGYRQTSPASVACEPICGDNVVVAGEQCDSGFACKNCQCEGFPPYSPAQRDCMGCGNGIIDGNETCDSKAPGCEDCRCTGSWKVRSPVGLTCEETEDKRKIIITATVSSAAVVVLIVATAVAIVFARRAKNAPRKLNVPIEVDKHDDNMFVVTSDDQLAGTPVGGVGVLTPSSGSGGTPGGGPDLSCVLPSTSTAYVMSTPDGMAFAVGMSPAVLPIRSPKDLVLTAPGSSPRATVAEGTAPVSTTAVAHDSRSVPSSNSFHS